MKTMTIGAKLTLTSGVMLGLTILLGSTCLSRLGTFKQQFDSTIEKSVRKGQLADSIALANAEMISAQRGLILGTMQKDQSELEKYKAAFQQSLGNLRNSLTEMEPLLSSEEGRAMTASIAAGVSEWLPHYDELLQQCTAGNVEEANRIRRDVAAPIYSKIDADARQMLKLQTRLIAEDQAAMAEQYTLSHWIVIGLLALNLAVAVGGMTAIRSTSRNLRQTVSELAESARQVAGAGSQISSASDSLAQGASEQAATLEQTSASAEEINSMARKNTENSRSAADLVSQSQREFTETNQSLEQMVKAMNEIKTSSGKISKIIKTIDEIAFQTNILALNAAVEAARAGEAGMGFAVVADEVRNLAQRSAQAAKDTAGLIEESISKSGEGKARVDHVAAAIRSITEGAAKIKMLVDEVNAGSQEQARGIDQVSHVIVQMDQVTQKTAASAEESAAAAKELTAQAVAMNDIVGRLRGMVGGGSGETDRRRAPASARKTPESDAVPVGSTVQAAKESFPLDDDF